MSNYVYNIMVIDDDMEIIEAYQNILSPNDEAYERLMALTSNESTTDGVSFVVETYRQGKDGFEALAAAKKEGRSFSVIFLDMRMPPGWDGLRTAEAIREIDRSAYIIIVTATTDRSWDFIEKELGERLMIIRKPFTKQEIRQAARVLSKAWEVESKCASLS